MADHSPAAPITRARSGATPGVRFLAGEEDAGERLDRLLASLAGVSRAQVRRWIDQQRVCVDGRSGRASQRVRAGETIEAEPPQPVRADVLAEAIPLAILHEDEDVIVIDKPAGLVVHPAPGHPRGTLVNALLHHCTDLAGIGGVLRPGIVHRLDRGTSGVLVAAKHDAAHAALAEQFRSHVVERVYTALVRGVPGAEAGEIDRPIGRHPRDRKRMSVRTRAGREAHTHWSIRRRFPASGIAWLEVRPRTGRTHQIRVHLASVGLPVLGDPIYGKARRAREGLTRPALHARVLGFDHPRSGDRVRFEASLPADLDAILSKLEGEGPG
ncbi:MAG: RluA family pseudouridine synthase [Myxococcota bacterium]